MAYLTRIFISYRRSEAAPDARALYEVLRRLIGEDKVFIDVESIQPGEDFVNALRHHLNRCNVMLVLIGSNWLGVDPASGVRRIDDLDDFVRLEVAHALEQNMRVIPILIDNAKMPIASVMPEVLKRLLTRQSLKLDFDRFGANVRHLIAELTENPEVLAKSPPVLLVSPVANTDIASSVDVAERRLRMWRQYEKEEYSTTEAWRLALRRIAMKMVETKEAKELLNLDIVNLRAAYEQSAKIMPGRILTDAFEGKVMDAKWQLSELGVFVLKDILRQLAQSEIASS